MENAVEKQKIFDKRKTFPSKKIDQDVPDLNPDGRRTGSKKKPFDHWLKKNRYYHKQVLKFYQFVVPKGSRVLQINCKNGYALNGVEPLIGVGIDQDPDAIAVASQRYPQYQFHLGTVDELAPQTFDYIILTSVTMEEYDIQDLFSKLRRFCDHSTRIVIDTYSYFWEPVLWLTQKLGMRRPTEFKNCATY